MDPCDAPTFPGTILPDFSASSIMARPILYDRKRREDSLDFKLELGLSQWGGIVHDS